MAKNTCIWLGEYFETFIKDKVGSGRYSNASEVIRAGLRMLEEEERNIELLREALAAGEQSGFATPFDSEQFLKEMKAKYIDARS